MSSLLKREERGAAWNSNQRDILVITTEPHAAVAIKRPYHLPSRWTHTDNEPKPAIQRGFGAGEQPTEGGEIGPRRWRWVMPEHNAAGAEAETRELGADCDHRMSLLEKKAIKTQRKWSASVEICEYCIKKTTHNSQPGEAAEGIAFRAARLWTRRVWRRTRGTAECKASFYSPFPETFPLLGVKSWHDGYTHTCAREIADTDILTRRRYRMH